MVIESVFENSNPLILELGVGKGQFLRDYATQYQNKNFLGVEKTPKWVRHATDRIQKRGLNNIVIRCQSAMELLETLPNGSVDECYIFFPDPWPKRRHWNRRLIQKALLEKLHSLLSADGKIFIITDHADYFHWIQNVMNPFLEKHFQEIPTPVFEFRSNYQMKYEKEGRPIYFLSVKKC